MYVCSLFLLHWKARRAESPPTHIDNYLTRHRPLSDVTRHAALATARGCVSSRERRDDDISVSHIPELYTNLNISFPMMPVHMLPVVIPTPVFILKRSFEDLMILSATRMACRLLYS